MAFLLPAYIIKANILLRLNSLTSTRLNQCQNPLKLSLKYFKLSVIGIKKFLSECYSAYFVQLWDPGFQSYAYELFVCRLRTNVSNFDIKK